MAVWTEAYAPLNAEEFAGNPSAREEALKWALDWKRGKRGKPLLLHGATGSGKTTLARCIAASAGFALAEASPDLFDDEKALAGLFEGGSLFGEARLVLVDSVDTAYKQREATQLAELASNAKGPVVFTAETLWERKIATLRAACQPVSLKAVNWLTVRKVLAGIAGKEDVAADLDSIARNSGGDLRAAINDLQGGSTGGGRNRKVNAFDGVRRVFKKGYAEALEAEREFDGELDLFIQWLAENVPREYEDPAALARAFEWLSRSDVFAGRIRKRQDYGLLRYVAAVGVGGVAAAKSASNGRFVPYAFPSAIQALGRSKESRTAFNGIAAKAGKKLHCSKREAKAMLAYYSFDAKGAAEYFGLDEKEAALLAELHEL
ncbi:MAG: AAA family ATPase [Candidatus Micrarchaeia archaeon]